jgi:uncharacterized membrane protein (UPF0127 family)
LLTQASGHLVLDLNISQGDARHLLAALALDFQPITNLLGHQLATQTAMFFAFKRSARIVAITSHPVNILLKLNFIHKNHILSMNDSRTIEIWFQYKKS